MYCLSSPGLISFGPTITILSILFLIKIILVSLFVVSALLTAFTLISFEVSSFPTVNLPFVSITVLSELFPLTLQSTPLLDASEPSTVTVYCFSSLGYASFSPLITTPFMNCLICTSFEAFTVWSSFDTAVIVILSVDSSEPTLTKPSVFIVVFIELLLLILQSTDLSAFSVPSTSATYMLSSFGSKMSLPLIVILVTDCLIVISLLPLTSGFSLEVAVTFTLSVPSSLPIIKLPSSSIFVLLELFPSIDHVTSLLTFVSSVVFTVTSHF